MASCWTPFSNPNPLQAPAPGSSHNILFFSSRGGGPLHPQVCASEAESRSARTCVCASEGEGQSARVWDRVMAGWAAPREGRGGQGFA